MQNQLTKEDYNNIPVFYCKHCLSLNIRDAGFEELVYCDHCSCIDIGEAHISEWEEMYKKKFDNVLLREAFFEYEVRDKT